MVSTFLFYTAAKFRVIIFMIFTIIIWIILSIMTTDFLVYVTEFVAIS